MRRWTYSACAAAAVILIFVASAFADLKIKTRTTVMGHTTESTVYIKGARERREMSFGGNFTSTTITQCDAHRYITEMANRCTSSQMGANGETACPERPQMGAMGQSGGRGGMFGGMFGRGQQQQQSEEDQGPPRKGGVVTITRNVSDTGERQDMFGYKARHIKTTMAMESSPDACNQSHTKIETDGWYADINPSFSCGDEGVRAMSCGAGAMGGGSAPRCQDRIVMKGSLTGGITGGLGYPLKQTTAIISDKGTFTTETEVTELSSVTLDSALFDAPPDCRSIELPPGIAAASEPAPAAAPAPTTTTSAPVKAAEPAPSAAPTVAIAPKGAGVIRIGVVKLNDATGQGLPTDNLILDLVNEIQTRNMEAVALTADAPPQDVMAEAREKNCDYVLYTAVKQAADPESALPAAVLPKGAALNSANAQAVSDMTLYKVTKPLPEIKDLALAADAPQLAVNAVMATFGQEAEKIAEQVKEDAHPQKAAVKAMKRPH
jgi:hypothetical protein